MQASILAQTAYSGAATPVRTARAVEYDAFARVTRRLSAAQAGGPAGFPALVAALTDNRRLWSALSADLVEPGNRLPDLLRARLLYLAEFTERHSRGVLAGDATADVLVDINTSVMRGLRGPGGEA